jgi:hypothetical protein
MYICRYVYIYMRVLARFRGFFQTVLKPSRWPRRPSDAPGSASETDGGSRIYEAVTAKAAACDPRTSEEVPVHRHSMESLLQIEREVT